MKNKAALSVMLALLLMGETILTVSCGGDSGTPSGETSDGAASETEAVYELPKADYGGKTINMFLWDGTTFVMEEEDGDVLDDAIYHRNRDVEELYNIKFAFQLAPGGVSDWSNWIGTLNASVMSGDDAIQLAGGYAYRLSFASLEGGFQNYNDMPQIDFSKPWWPSNLTEAGNLGGALYMVLGNIERSYYDNTYMMGFNKRLAEEQKVGDLYQMVRDGKWTTDVFNTVIKNSGADINGDSVLDLNDQYGYVTDLNMGIDAWINACNVKITEREKDGTPYLPGLTDHYVEVQEWVKSMTEQPYVWYNSTLTGIFRGGRALLTRMMADGMIGFRDMEDDFGVLPYPKWDEEQESYQTYNSIGNATGFAVPVTADADMMGTIIEALAYLGWRDVLPEYYEKSLKGKSARDDESEEMLDIVFNNIRYDFTQFYSYVFGDQKSPSMLMRMTLKENREIASMWAADESLYQETMKKLIETLK